MYAISTASSGEVRPRWWPAAPPSRPRRAGTRSPGRAARVSSSRSIQSACTPAIAGAATRRWPARGSARRCAPARGGHVVGHRGQQRVPVGGQPAGRDLAGEQDLDVDLVVGGVHPGRVVDEVGVDLAAAAGVLDPAALGQPEVAALADAPRPQLGAVDPQPVVGLVADLGVGLGAGLDVGADAAVPQQVDRGLEGRVDQLGRGQRVDPVAEPERAAYGLGHRDRLERARVDPAAAPRSASGRSRPSSTAAARTAAPARPSSAPGPGRGRGRRAGGRTRDQPQVPAEQHPVAEHVAAHVADPDAGEVVGLAGRARARAGAGVRTPRPRGR